MSTRVRKLEMDAVAEELPEQPSPPHALPLLATSVFCDDVRLEANGKVMLIGCYPGNVIISEASQRIERLRVFTKLIWRTPFDPEGLRLRADFSAQAAVFMCVQVDPMQRDGMAGNASGTSASTRSGPATSCACRSSREDRRSRRASCWPWRAPSRRGTSCAAGFSMNRTSRSGAEGRKSDPLLGERTRTHVPTSLKHRRRTRGSESYLAPAFRTIKRVFPT